MATNPFDRIDPGVAFGQSAVQSFGETFKAVFGLAQQAKQNKRQATLDALDFRIKTNRIKSQESTDLTAEAKAALGEDFTDAIGLPFKNAAPRDFQSMLSRATRGIDKRQKEKERLTALTVDAKKFGASQADKAISKLFPKADSVLGELPFDSEKAQKAWDLTPEEARNRLTTRVALTKKFAAEHEPMIQKEIENGTLPDLLKRVFAANGLEGDSFSPENMVLDTQNDIPEPRQLIVGNETIDISDEQTTEEAQAELLFSRPDLAIEDVVINDPGVSRLTTGSVQSRATDLEEQFGIKSQGSVDPNVTFSSKVVGSLDSLAPKKPKPNRRVESLRSFENIFTKVTRDDARGGSSRSIGHGHKLTPEDFNTGVVNGVNIKDVLSGKRKITKSEANKIFLEDIRIHDKEAGKLLSKKGINRKLLSKSQLEAINNMVFQLGVKRASRFKNSFRKLRKFLDGKETIENVIKEFGSGKDGPSNWRKQTPSRFADFARKMRK